MTDNKIKIYDNFLAKNVSALYLRALQNRRNLWQKRNTADDFRNGEWFTVGGSCYLDLVSEEKFPDYLKSVSYWREIFTKDAFLMSLIIDIQYSLNRIDHFKNKPILFLAEYLESVNYPGLHIFPGFDSSVAAFGKMHRDLQYEGLLKIPEVKDFFEGKQIEEHISFTIPLQLPYMGGGLVVLDGKEEEYIEYKERSLYIHSGDFEHMIAPFTSPVLQGDQRVTVQGHGIVTKDAVYLYW